MTTRNDKLRLRSGHTIYTTRTPNAQRFPEKKWTWSVFSEGEMFSTQWGHAPTRAAAVAAAKGSIK